MKISWMAVGVGLAVLVAVEAGDSKEVSGVLVDRMCGETAAWNYEKVLHHEVSCSLMRNCRDSGFGIVVDGRFLRFDARGNELAVELLEKTDQRRSVRVEVEGPLKGEEISVRGLRELP